VQVISFRPTEEETAFIEVAKDLAINKIRPLIKEVDQNSEGLQETLSQMSELGFLDMELPESWHGLELPLISQVQILKALSYGDLDFIQSLPGAGDAASLIRLLPETEEMQTFREKYLSAENKTIAYTEAVDQEMDWGSTIQLENDGDGYILSGRTLPTRLAMQAHFVVISTTDSFGRIVIFYLDHGDWEKEENNQFGLVSSGIASLQFHREKIAKSQVLSIGDQAEKVITQARGRIQILQAAKEVGLAEAALDYATEYTAGRYAFGQEIAKFQGVSFRIAKMAIEGKAANNLVLEAAVNTDRKSTNDSLALRGLQRAHRAVCFATDSAVQLLGGHGFIREYPVEKWMRDAQAQVMLYGKEKDLLLQYGKRLVEEEKDVARL
jgi:alkylation response protein AidB-like acyl-CoA dehydrogenase